MSDELFFLPMITDALRQPDPRAAMSEAFERILAMGQEPRYRVGYRQFLRFMDAAGASLEEDALQAMDARLLDELDRPASIELVLERQDMPVGACSFDRPAGTRTLRGIVPGPYRLRTDTGVLLWEGSLSPQDVIWVRAFPGRDLPMAADTGDVRREPTLELELLGGTLWVRLFPGLEAGSVEITLKSMGAATQ